MYYPEKLEESAILVFLNFGEDHHRYEDALGEFHELAEAAGAKVVAVLGGKRVAPDPKYYVGRGKVDEIQQTVAGLETPLVIFNHDLSPAQERNLERQLKCRVLDRTGLILDIFARRARTYEGKLQVELAQLEHLSTRLVRGWTHLERQKGGIGLRGPGETQLETDRRLLRDRIKQINKRLVKVRAQRAQGRRQRKRAVLPSISLVGYTNAGKSTLFNRLTASKVYAADKLFATLDPTLRRIQLPSVGQAVLADTVGFIRALPHELVESFRATLEEAQEADLLLHVIDATAKEREDKMGEVNKVLEDIGALDRPILEVFNKIDCMAGVAPRIERDSHELPRRVWLSAQTGVGLELLKDAISELVPMQVVEEICCVDAVDGATRAHLYDKGEVLEERADEAGRLWIKVRIPKHLLPPK